MEVVYGTPMPLPINAKPVTFTNEDFGFNASLVWNTNDHEQFDLPIPASIDEWYETYVIWKMQFSLIETPHYTDDKEGGLTVWLSYLNRSLSVAWGGVLSDSQDEWVKSQFAGPMYFGPSSVTNTDTNTAAVGGQIKWPSDDEISAIYYPEIPLDQSYPMRVTLHANAFTVDPDTNDETSVDFTGFEKVIIRCWFTKRNLSRAEIDARAPVQRFLHIES